MLIFANKLIPSLTFNNLDEVRDLYINDNKQFFKLIHDNWGNMGVDVGDKFIGTLEYIREKNPNNIWEYMSNKFNTSNHTKYLDAVLRAQENFLKSWNNIKKDPATSDVYKYSLFEFEFNVNVKNPSNKIWNWNDNDFPNKNEFINESSSNDEVLAPRSRNDVD